MHLSTLLIVLFAAVSSLGPQAQARAPALRDLPNVVVDGPRGSSQGLAGNLTPGRWVLIVVDAHRVNGLSLMDALKRSGYEGSNAIVLVIGDEASAKAVRRRDSRLPAAQWLTARTSVSLKSLGLGGTPVVLGIDAEQRIAWQESGVPRRVGDLAVRISDWTRR